MSKKPFYITTTLPYVNADAHVGHALEQIRADIVARWKRLTGHEVFFNTGTDEHGNKIYQKAIETGQDVQAYVDYYAERFKKLKKVLNLSYDNFIRTTDLHHIAAAQAFWKICLDKGDIYKKNYKTKYCTGCEMEKTDSELDEKGRCLIHPQLEIEIIEEENYFFRYSKYQQSLLDLYQAHPDLVIPHTRLNEIKSFVSNGLQDFSISRLKSKMPWGIPVPGDDEQVMYVWFDALVNYIAAIGWPENMDKFKKWAIESGGMVQYCGKDNLRPQAAMWQAMLLSASLPASKNIIIDGFVTGEGGIKMSKSMGNIVDPIDVVNEYGTDALRYMVARELHCFEDSPFSLERVKEAYNSGLANGLGNLVSRVMKMATTHLEGSVEILDEVGGKNIPEDFINFLEGFEIQQASHVVWKHIAECDAYIQETQPFKLVKVDKEKALVIIRELVQRVYAIACMLESILPETSEKIKTIIREHRMPEIPLFVRKD
ncbi:MAG: methionine--tRNA ligase [Candidatus Pacebacteria bacterium]|nr:methionine--tRNA ligase [Candidatus Paceibacterota bacterium]